jgi:long-chain acyl-CoA synthetase
MIALPDGQKVYPEDVETALRLDDRVRDATVVAWPPGPNLRVHAVLLMDDAAAADAVVRATKERLAPHQHIRGTTVWPDPDLPRTHTLKVRKPDVLARLQAMRAGDPGTPVAAPAAGGDGVEADPVTTIVAAIAGRAPGNIDAGHRLSSDLDLDSLRRVELLGVIEEELGVFVDDDALAPDATVGELVALVEGNREARRRPGSWTWPLNPLVRTAGLAVQVLLMQPFVRASYRVRTSGLEHLEGLDGPVLLTPNHCLHLDNAIILSRLPLGVRWHLSMAAAADTIYDNPIQGAAASIIANAFPLQREGGVRRSLELLGQRLDRGFSIVLYPEGKLTLGGPVQPFMAGAGLVAVEGGTPVIPVKIRINRMSVVDRRRLPGPLRGDVELVLGAPVVFDADTDHATATTRLEAALAAL